MPDSTPDVSELARQVVDELDGTRQIGNQILLSRREAIAVSTGAISLGALGVAGVGNASAQSGVGQVGTEAEPVDVEGAQGNFSQGVTVDGPLEAEGAVISDYYYTARFEGSDPTERLENTVEASSTGDRIYLEYETFNNFELTRGQRRQISGVSSTPGSGTGIDESATWSIGSRCTIQNLNINGDLEINSERCSVLNVSFPTGSGSITVKSDGCVLSQIAGASGSIVFESGTSGSELGVVSSEPQITDNGNNSILTG